MSTFDDPNRLLIHFHRLSPLKPSIIQMTSPQKDGVGKPTNSDYLYENETTTKTLDILILPSDDASKTNASSKLATSEMSSMESLAQKSVPLSIIVAIGCSLLFINILILAAVCYQRKRIQSPRLGNLQSKDDQFAKLNKLMGGDDKTDDGDKCMEIQSTKNEAPPRNAIYSQPIKPIRTLYPIRADSPAHSYSYSPVSTISSSPLHKVKAQNTTTNSIPNTYQEFSTFQTGRPPDNPDKDCVMSTFKAKSNAVNTSTTTVVW